MTVVFCRQESSPKKLMCLLFTPDDENFKTTKNLESPFYEIKKLCVPQGNFRHLRGISKQKEYAILNDVEFCWSNMLMLFILQNKLFASQDELQKNQHVSFRLNAKKIKI